MHGLRSRRRQRRAANATSARRAEPGRVSAVSVFESSTSAVSSSGDVTKTQSLPAPDFAALRSTRPLRVRVSMTPFLSFSQTPVDV